MLKELFIRRPRFKVEEIAATIYAKFFREEIKRTLRKIKEDVIDPGQLIEKQKLTLVIISLFVFIVEYSTSAVYGDSKTRKKIIDSFYLLIRKEYKEYSAIITELSRRFSLIHEKKPDDPLFGIGLYFSRCICRKNNQDLLLAMVGSTETAKKSRIIINYYQQLNGEYKIY